QHLLGCHRHDLGIGRHETPLLDQVDKLRPDLAGYPLADATVLLDIGPFPDQIEMIGIPSVATEHPVLDLLVRAMKRVVVAVIELVEELDELVARAGFDPEIVDVKVVSLGRQRYESHWYLFFDVMGYLRRGE